MTLTQAEVERLLDLERARGRFEGAFAERQAWVKDIERIFGDRLVSVVDIPLLIRELTQCAQRRIEAERAELRELRAK